MKEDTKKTVSAEKSHAVAGSEEVKPGVFVDPTTGLERPMHYPPAIVIDEDMNEGKGSVKTPTVTPDEFNRKVNPADARVNDSEYVIRVASMEEAQKLQDSSRKELPAEAQDPAQGSR